MRLRTTHIRSLSVCSVLLASMVLAGIPSALEVGQQAPDFVLSSTTGEQISLSQFRGKQHVLLEFFIGATMLTGT